MKRKTAMMELIEIINGRIYYLGIYGDLFQDITDLIAKESKQ